MTGSLSALMTRALGGECEESISDSRRVGDQCNESRVGNIDVALDRLARSVLGCRYPQIEVPGHRANGPGRDITGKVRSR